MADTTTGAGGTDWGSILSSIFSGFNAITGQAGKDATTAANRADPWGPQRGQYQDQLNTFMKDPSTIFQDPAFQAARDQGLQGVARTMGASGMGNSGNTQAALYKYGDTFAYDAENNKYKQLADLAGVNAGSPAAAGAIMAQGNNNQNANTAAGLTGVGSLLSTLIGAGIPQGIATQIANAFSGAGGGGGLGGFDWGGVTDPGGLASGSLDTSGLNPFGVDPTVAGDLNNIFNTGSNPMFDPSIFAGSGVSDSTGNLLGSLTGVFGGPG